MITSKKQRRLERLWNAMARLRAARDEARTNAERAKLTSRIMALSATRCGLIGGR